MSMNIYAKPGTKLRFTNTGGFDWEKEAARTLLDTETVYILEFACVDSSRTDIYLEGFHGRHFNSVMFEEVE